jgi:hypothetical protein
LSSSGVLSGTPSATLAGTSPSITVTVTSVEGKAKVTVGKTLTLVIS